MDREQRPIRLLLIEDSDDDAELIRHELTRAGLAYEWLRVDTRHALQEALASREWDIALSDFAMPGFDGLEAFRIISAMDEDIPFVFVSGAIGEERAAAAMRAGARDYVLKDNLRRLAGVVRREIEELAGRRDRRAAEAEARREGRRLAIAVEASGAGVFEFDFARRDRSHLSARWAKILGFDVRELPVEAYELTWFMERVHGDDRASVLAAFGRFVAGVTDSFEAEARVAHRDGSWRSVALFGKPIAHDASGRVSRLVGVMLDLTERRRLEDALRQSQKMEAIGRLAGGVAHDFNNLITVIFAFGEFVCERLEEGSEARADMEEVLDAARRAAELTGQLLAFSRRHPITPKVLSPNDIVGGLERMLQRILGEDVMLDVRLDPDVSVVRIDPGALEQVIVNLAVNARDAMPEGGRLGIRTGSRTVTTPEKAAAGHSVPPGRYVGIHVEDEGAGMEGRVLERIFEPFFTTKAAGKGTGLGLSTCYGIIEQAGGYLMVDSAPGRGSTFRILLPVAEDTAEPVTEPVPAGGEATVLVVDGDPRLRQLVARALGQHGCRVLEAGDAHTARRVFTAEPVPPALLLADALLPDGDGAGLAEALSAEHPGLRVLYMSGQAPAAISGILDQGATVLRKPFRPETLVQAVGDALGPGREPE